MNWNPIIKVIKYLVCTYYAPICILQTSKRSRIYATDDRHVHNTKRYMYVYTFDKCNIFDSYLDSDYFM